MNLSSTTKLHLETAGIVFISSLLVTVGSSVQSLSATSLSWSLLLSLITTAIGVAARSAFTAYFSNSVGAQLKNNPVQ